jgi:hypothetical protein
VKKKTGSKNPGKLVRAFRAIKAHREAKGWKTTRAHLKKGAKEFPLFHAYPACVGERRGDA